MPRLDSGKRRFRKRGPSGSKSLRHHPLTTSRPSSTLCPGSVPPRSRSFDEKLAKLGCQVPDSSGKPKKSHISSSPRLLQTPRRNRSRRHDWPIRQAEVAGSHRLGTDPRLGNLARKFLADRDQTGAIMGRLDELEELKGLLDQGEAVDQELLIRELAHLRSVVEQHSQADAAVVFNEV